MSQRTYTVNLASSYLPVAATDVGAQVIMLGADTQPKRRLTDPEWQDSNSEVPQTLFVENLLPSQTGWCSYETVAVSDAEAVLPENWTCAGPMLEVYGESLDVFVKVVVCKNGASRALYFISSSDPATWSLAGFATLSNNLVPELSSARVQGIGYICVSGVGLFTFDADGNDLLPVDMLGLTVTEIQGVLAAAGYVVAYSKDSTAWSSALDLQPAPSERSTAYVLGDTVLELRRKFTVTTAGTTSATAPSWAVSFGATVTDGTVVWTCAHMELDFVPNELTGAGGGTVEEAEGVIVTAKVITGGFILYTTGNAVAALGTSNASYPFLYKRIQSCGGLASPYFVTVADTQSGHYAWTSRGLQLVATTGAKSVFPVWAEALTKLAGVAEYQHWFVDSGVLQYEDSSALVTQLLLCAGRYLCMNCGDLVLVYDLHLNRAGAGTILNGSYLFSYSGLSDLSTVPTIADRSAGLIGVTSPLGALFAWLPFSEGGNSAASASLLVLGNFKHVHGKDVTMLGLDLKHTKATPIVVTLAAQYADATEYGAFATGANRVANSVRTISDVCLDAQSHAFGVTGKFQLSQAVITYSTEGSSR